VESGIIHFLREDGSAVLGFEKSYPLVPERKTAVDWHKKAIGIEQ
jgi:hypothetical protein